MKYKRKISLFSYILEPKLGDTLLKVSGITKKLGVPVLANVFLIKNSAILLSTKSDANGNYEFANLLKGHVYTVFSRDSSKQYNAVIQDNVVPK